MSETNYSKGSTSVTVNKRKDSKGSTSVTVNKGKEFLFGKTILVHVRGLSDVLVLDPLVVLVHTSRTVDWVREVEFRLGKGSRISGNMSPVLRALSDALMHSLLLSSALLCTH